MNNETDQIQSKSPERWKKLKEYLLFVGFIASYFILQLWVLPSFGVQT